jgi:hypothetical protein
MAAIVLAGAALTALVGERIGVNGGQGWDGLGYTVWAQDFWHKVVEDGMTRYHSQRIFPSAVVHYGLRLAGLPRDVPHVILGFQILDTVVLAAAAALWAHLGGVMQWRRAARWVGFVALFGCFANARHALYYPTLTDPTAFALGMTMLWGYLTGRAWAIWAAGLIGVFTWPALPPIAIAMLVLPRPHSPVEPAAERGQKWRVAAAIALSLLGSAIFLLIARHYLEHPVRGVGDEKFAQWVRRDLLVLTIPTLLAMLGLGWYLLLQERRLWNVRGYLRQLSARRTALALIGAGLLVGVRWYWLREVGTRGEGPSSAQFLCEHSLAAIRGPLWGLVHQVVYFGPIILVAALSWRRIAAVAAAWGPAAVLALAMALAFAAGSNSRQWNHLVPLVVAAAIAVTDERWTAGRAIAFSALALAWSKLWLTIGYDRHHHWHEFPDQRYFMNHGPYANDSMYLIHLIAAVLTGLALFLVLRGSRERTIGDGEGQAASSERS